MRLSGIMVYFYEFKKNMMGRKMRRLFVFVFIALFAHNVAFSADVDFAKELESINELAKDDFEGFLLGLNNSFGVKKSKIKKMMAEHKMKPSDVFMALKLSSVTERLLDEVIKSFRENRGKGCGVHADSGHPRDPAPGIGHVDRCLLVPGVDETEALVYHQVQQWQDVITSQGKNVGDTLQF